MARMDAGGKLTAAVQAHNGCRGAKGRQTEEKRGPEKETLKEGGGKHGKENDTQTQKKDTLNNSGKEKGGKAEVKSQHAQ